MTHHAATRHGTAEQPVRRRKAPISTGRLALWLGFWLIIAFTVLGTVVSMTGHGAK